MAKQLYMSHGLLDAELGIVGLELHRPPRNMLNLDYLRQLNRALRAINENPAHKGLLISSKQKHFCGGLDLRELFPEGGSKMPMQQLTKCWLLVQQIWKGIYGSPLVSLACLEGDTLGSGAMLALACDFRLMSDSQEAVFGLDEASFGIAPASWAVERLGGIVGKDRAERMASWGEPMSARECHHRGLVDRLAPSKGALQEQGFDYLAARVRARTHGGMEARRALREEALGVFEAQQQEEATWMAEFWSEEDTRVQVVSCLNKRKI